MSVEILHTLDKQRQDFEQVLDIVLNKGILTEEGFVSDPFLCLKHILLADPGNLPAKIFLSTTSELYRKYGDHSKVYFTSLANIYENTKKHLVSIKGFEEELSDYQIMISLEASDYTDEFMRKCQISEDTIKLFVEADGKEIFLKRGFETKISKKSGFVAKVFRREDFFMSQTSVFVVEGEADLDVVVSLINQSQLPLLVISLSDNKHLVELERLNPQSGFRFVKVLPEYLRQDLILDLKSVVNQSLSSSVLLRSATALGTAKVSCLNDELTLETKDSFVKHQRIQGLKEEVQNEKSPLRKMSLNNRLTNLRGERTTLYLQTKSELEFNVELSKYFTEILEAINMLNSGVVLESDLTKEPYSFDCINSSFMQAKQDLKLIFSDTYIIQK